MLDARLRGLNEPDAWAAALREAGPALPAALHLGEQRLHRAVKVGHRRCGAVADAAAADAAVAAAAAAAAAGRRTRRAEPAAHRH